MTVVRYIFYLVVIIPPLIQALQPDYVEGLYRIHSLQPWHVKPDYHCTVIASTQIIIVVVVLLIKKRLKRCMSYQPYYSVVLSQEASCPARFSATIQIDPRSFFLFLTGNQ